MTVADMDAAVARVDARAPEFSDLDKCRALRFSAEVLRELSRSIWLPIRPFSAGLVRLFDAYVKARCG